MRAEARTRSRNVLQDLASMKISLPVSWPFFRRDDSLSSSAFRLSFCRLSCHSLKTCASAKGSLSCLYDPGVDSENLCHSLKTCASAKGSVGCLCDSGDDSENLCHSLKTCTSAKGSLSCLYDPGVDYENMCHSLKTCTSAKGSVSCLCNSGDDSENLAHVCLALKGFKILQWI